MGVEIQRVPWRRGDTPQWDGVGWRQAVAATSGQFWQMQSTGLWAPHTLVAGDIPQLAHSALSGLTSGDDHTQYRLESADHSHLTTGLQGGTITAAAVSDFSEAAQDAIGSILVDGSTIDFTYDDATPQIFAEVKANSLDASAMVNRTRSFYMPADMFFISSGTPAFAGQGSNLLYSAYAFDAAATENIVSAFKMPHDYVAGAITAKLHWTNLGAGSGDVAWILYMQNKADAVDLNSSSLTSGANTVTAPAQNVQKITTSGISFTPTATPALIEVLVQRFGGDAADTLGNDAGFVGLTIEYTADS